MYIKTPISTPPPIGEWVVVIDQEDNMFIARFTSFEVNYRDLSGTNTPSNNIALTHWLKKVDEHEEFGQRIDQLENYIFAMNMPLSPEMHVDQMKKGLGEVVPILKAVYVELFGENPWQ